MSEPDPTAPIEAHVVVPTAVWDAMNTEDEPAPTGDVLADMRRLCESRMTDGADGGMVDADTIWPSEVLAILDRPR